MKKTLFLLCALYAATTASATEYWVQGVDKTGGWYDTNKTDDNESGFCWAATDTNIISWWQEHNKPAAQAAAANGAPQTQQEIWNLYKSSFVNGTGHPNDGLKWYLSGDTPQSPSITDSTKGGYYKDLEVTADIVTKYMFSYDSAWELYEFAENHFMWYKPGETDPNVDARKLMAADMAGYLGAGYAIALGMTSYDRVNKGTSNHAATLWGIEIDDETGLMTKMWITDSDDQQYTLDNGMPKYDSGDRGLIALNCLALNEDFGAPGDDMNFYGVESVKPGENGDLWYKYNEKEYDYIYQFTAIKLTSFITPEPSTATLSLLALAGLAARRRRK